MEVQMNSDIVAMERRNLSRGSSAKREKFVELAQKRTVNAIKAIRVIGKLGNKSAYEYTDADVRKIVKALSAEVDAMRARMTSKTGRDTVEFEL